MRSKTGDSSGLERTGKILMLTFSRMDQLNRNIFNTKDRHLLPKEVFYKCFTEQWVETSLHGGDCPPLTVTQTLFLSGHRHAKCSLAVHTP